MKYPFFLTLSQLKILSVEENVDAQYNSGYNEKIQSIGDFRDTIQTRFFVKTLINTSSEHSE